MKIYEIYFSPTGGTEKVVDMVGMAWKGEKEKIDLFTCNERPEHSFDNTDICLVAAPAFGGRVPALAIERMLRLKGNGAKAIPIAVYGNREYDDTLLELKDTLENLGFCCVAAIGAIAEHSIFHQYATNRPDEEDAKELIQFGLQIQEHIKAGSQGALVVKGNYPYKEAKSHLSPFADNTCTLCGLCASQCPVQAIPKENPKMVDGDKCISCMHCISVCPTHSRINDDEIVSRVAKMLEATCSIRKKNELFV